MQKVGRRTLAAESDVCPARACCSEQKTASCKQSSETLDIRANSVRQDPTARPVTSHLTEEGKRERCALALESQVCRCRRAPWQSCVKRRYVTAERSPTTPLLSPGKSLGRYTSRPRRSDSLVVLVACSELRQNRSKQLKSMGRIAELAHYEKCFMPNLESGDEGKDPESSKQNRSEEKGTSAGHKLGFEFFFFYNPQVCNLQNSWRVSPKLTK